MFEIEQHFLNQVLLLMLPMVRISALIFIMPIFGTQLVPPKVRIVLALVLSYIVATNVAPQHLVLPNTEMLSLVILTGLQVLIGLLMGLMVHIVFQAFTIAGQIIAMQMGLGFASMIDPQNGINVPMLGQFYLMLVTLLYLSVNGHIYLLQVLMESFTYIPISINSLSAEHFSLLLTISGWMFISAIKIALPAITALLIVNITFGVMTKSAPQLNVFTLGFPLTMLFGVATIWVSLYTVLPEFYILKDKIHQQLTTVFVGGR